MSTSAPSIYFMAISYGTKILASHSLVPGTQASVLTALLTSLPLTNPQKTVLSYSNSLWHLWLDEKGWLFAVMTDDQTSRRVAFLLLDELRQSFYSSYPELDPEISQEQSLTGPMRDVMDTLMHHPPVDTVQVAQDELAAVREVMIQNIDRVMERGERIEVLVDKTEGLSGMGAIFRKRSSGLRRRMEWKNIRLMVIVVSVLLMVGYFVSGWLCGFPAWGRCLAAV